MGQEVLLVLVLLAYDSHGLAEAIKDDGLSVDASSECFLGERFGLLDLSPNNNIC